MELFAERGYEQTTAAQIAAQAGVTERTYFRHFGDKRDILFEGEERLESMLVEGIANAPTGLGPMTVLRHVLGEVGSTLEDSRLFSAPRHAVISATPALREREASKQAMMMHAMAAALVKRGFESKEASLAARIGGALFVYALAAWFEDGSVRLEEWLDRAFQQLRMLDRT